MKKNVFEQTKGSNNKSNINKDTVLNMDMVSMYNMPNMTSGPSDATLEEKQKVKVRSLENKGTDKK